MDRKGVLAKGALLLFSTAIALLVVEVFARVYLAKPIALVPSYGNSFQAIFLSPIVQKIAGSDLPWELKPNYAGHFKLTKFTTNAHGLRANRDFDFHKPAGTYRVAVIGDSFTMPSGVPIEDAYHSVLERKLNESSAGHFEFLNFGVGGYSLQNYLTVLVEKALAYQPDHVLIGLCLANDIPVVKRKEPKLRARHASGILTLKNPFYGYWTLDLIERARSSRAERPAKNKTFDLEELDRVLSEFKAVRDANRLAMTFVTLKLSASQKKHPYRTMANHLDKHSLALVDGGSEFGPHGGLEYATTRLDRHPNAAANRKFANALLSISWGRLLARASGGEGSQ